MLPYGSAVYRDLPRGRYRVTVENSAAADDSKTIALEGVEEAFAKIGVADAYLTGGGGQGVHRETFSVWPVAPGHARAEMPTPP